ncbi:AraC family transcriptional regulator [Paenibacillus eucommiae]|uniref:YesN/AraC family two-component response regulator n=1 Tax=Paenibacillus eucommiae TaxID=1355755 RepID=A0ABS4ILL6_9BACL|nr:AraC family transcriptional regulator [Paenibacillus eucommiae]MBP1988457.1 YesN/AraC family two-component response regulator [Paenibacillus eucommiae]
MHIRTYGYDSDSSLPVHYMQDYRHTPPFQNRLGGIHPDHHEILYIIEGTVQLHRIKRVYEIEGPALILLPLNTYHQLVHISKQYSYAYWELEDEQFSTFPTPRQCTIWNDLQFKLDVSLSEINVVYQRANELNKLMHTDLAQQQPDLIRDICLSDIKTMLTLICHIVKPHEQHNEHLVSQQIDRLPHIKETIEMLIRWMEASYWEDITLQTLSDMVHFNPSYLIRMFKEYQGETPFQYLNRLRMNAAISYLANTNMSVQEIAFTIGYQSIHYFSRLFKQTYGKSPVQWRIEHKIPTL